MSKLSRLVVVMVGLLVALFSLQVLPVNALTLTAAYRSDGQPIVCPPGCQEADDVLGPITFEVCTTEEKCLQVPSGSAVSVVEETVIRAPQGAQPFQLPTMEEDSFLKFISWSDGNTENPRTIPAASGGADLTAYYAFYVGTPASNLGCGGDVGIFSGTSAHWFPVRGNDEYQDLTGAVAYLHVSPEDLFTDHNSNDVNMFVALSGRDEVLLLSKENGQYGDRPHQIEVEWESASYPRWAWPSSEREGLDQDPTLDDADKVWVRGAYIYDCGHPSPEIDRGAWTEIHPPIAVASMRGTRDGRFFLRDDLINYVDLDPDAVGMHAVKVDLWINADGGGAGTNYQCAEVWASGSGCITNSLLNIKELYEFDVPIPAAPEHLLPKPELKTAFLRLQPGQPRPQVAFDAANSLLHVRLDLRNYEDTRRTCLLQNQLYNESLGNCAGDAYGVTIVAGWQVRALPEDFHRVRLTVNSIQMMTDSETEPSDGEFRFWLDVGPALSDPGRASSVPLHEINTGLNDAPGDGESYDLIEDGNPLVFTFNILEGSGDTNKLAFRLHGYEDDPLWDDDMGEINRVFHKGFVEWEPSGIKPEWATQSYGEETSFGTVRQGVTTSVVPYRDPAVHTCVQGQNPVPCVSHWLNYTIEELPVP